jgi:hypothetical protein
MKSGKSSLAENCLQDIRKNLSESIGYLLGKGFDWHFPNFGMHTAIVRSVAVIFDIEQLCTPLLHVKFAGA